LRFEDDAEVDVPKKSKADAVARPSILSRFLTAVENIGNALPHPATLFAIFALGLIFLSWLSSKLGLAAVNPRDGVAVIPINLISRDGLHWILENTIVNFTSFAPLGTVLVAMLGIGTVIATMLPYSIAFLVVWMALLVVWLLSGLPLGPGGDLYLQP
jgi:aminobenzoyl-glutamate transport protein